MYLATAAGGDVQITKQYNLNLTEEQARAVLTAQAAAATVRLAELRRIEEEEAAKKAPPKKGPAKPPAKGVRHPHSLSSPSSLVLLVLLRYLIARMLGASTACCCCHCRLH